jgi:ATP-dependent Lon protease
MESKQLEHMAAMRAVVGFLGEKGQAAWWPSSFFAPGSTAFLSLVFPRTQFVAQCLGVTAAASKVHDERIGVGQVYHPVQEPTPTASTEEPTVIAQVREPEPQEQHFTIRYGETGHSFETILGPYLTGAKQVVVEDPYIRITHQVQNLVRLCEAVVKLSAVKKIRLLTSYDNQEQLTDVQQKFEELKQSLLEMDIELDVELNPNMHDREIRIDNGWVIKIGRGLDFFQKPNSWFDIGVNDLTLRKCLETKVDIFREK